MNVGEAIRIIRNETGITQGELARKCDLSQTSLSQIETGAKIPSSRTIKRICKVFDIPESVIYILAMQEGDISANKRAMYHLIYPSIKSLALKMIYPDEKEEIIKTDVLSKS